MSIAVMFTKRLTLIRALSAESLHIQRTGLNNMSFIETGFQAVKLLYKDGGQSNGARS
jgi:hypothetical protein